MLHRFRAARDERGVSAIEYGIIASLIAVVIISVVGMLGGNLSSVFGRIPDKIGSMAPDPDNGGGNNGGGDTRCNADGSWPGGTAWLRLNSGIADDNTWVWVNYPTSASTKIHETTDASGQIILEENLADRAQDGMDEIPFSDLGVLCENSGGNNGGEVPNDPDHITDDHLGYDGNLVWMKWRPGSDAGPEWSQYPAGAAQDIMNYWGWVYAADFMVLSADAPAAGDPWPVYYWTTSNDLYRQLSSGTLSAWKAANNAITGDDASSNWCGYTGPLVWSNVQPAGGGYSVWYQYPASAQQAMIDRYFGQKQIVKTAQHPDADGATRLVWTGPDSYPAVCNAG